MSSRKLVTLVCMSLREQSVNELVEYIGFYVDETTVEIGGRSHLLVAAIGFSSPHLASLKMVEIKRDFGLSPYSEVKYSQKQSPIDDKDLRYRYSQRVLDLIRDYASIICFTIVEKEAKENQVKQFASELLFQQIVDLIDKEKKSSYTIMFDQDLVSNLNNLWNKAENHLGIKCLSIQEGISSHDHLIQCADILAGSFKMYILKCLADEEKPVRIFVGHPSPWETDDGYVYLELSAYLFLQIRYLIPGEMIPLPKNEDDFDFVEHQTRHTMGHGIRLHSSISPSIKEAFDNKVAKFFLGSVF
jgi:hypothetical protein